MRLSWWRRVRPADIPPDLRERFEFYGETLLTLTSQTEPNAHVLGVELEPISNETRGNGCLAS